MCMEVLDDWEAEKPTFHYAMNDRVSGVKATVKKCKPLEFYRSLYADDGAFLLTSRAQVENAEPVIFRVLKAFGLTMHVGRIVNGVEKASKTEAVFFPSARDTELPDPLNTANISVDGGFISFSQSFKYLGSIIASNLSDLEECEARISAASKAFGALRAQFFEARGVELRAKRGAYEGIVANILLYGSETWALTQEMRTRIRSFHRRCVRIMCGITIMEMLERNIHHTALEKKLNVKNILNVLRTRRLQWAGHVYRMPETRLPRRFLTSWVPHSRPVGRPYFTYGHGLECDLKEAGLNKKGWGKLAMDRVSWRALSKGT